MLMVKSLILILIFCSFVFSQQKFEIKNASKNYDVKIDVEKCENGFCEGKAKFSLFRKNADKPFQIINLNDTELWLDKSGQAQANVTLRYDEQSAVNFDDFNFDGFEDIAVCDGRNGSYGMPSYQVYLFSPKTGKFIHNLQFSKLGQHLGMFEIDRKHKTLLTFDKSTCCEHYLVEYKIVNGRPKKIKEINEYYNLKNNGYTVTETRKLINGKWRTWIKREKIKDEK